MDRPAKSPLALALDKFFESPEGKKLVDGGATGKFLKNRLEVAFLAGAKAGKKIAAETLAKLLED